MVGMLRFANGNGDTDTNLNTEHVMSRTAQLGILTNITVQVSMINLGEILKEIFPHAIKGDLVHEAIIGDKADDAVPIFQPLDSPAKKLHIRRHRALCLVLPWSLWNM